MTETNINVPFTNLTFPQDWPEITASFGNVLLMLAFVLASSLPAQLLPPSNLFLQPRTLIFPAADVFTNSLSPASYPFKPGSVLGVTSSAYSSEVGQTDASPFTTASGTTTRPGVIAANFLPIGSKVRIGSTVYTVEDRMNARYSDTYRIDIWMTSSAAARAHGVRPLIMEIVSLPQ